MRKQSSLTITAICIAFCAVTLSYAASVLTPSQMGDTWGAGACETCVAMGSWVGPIPSCSGSACTTVTACPSTTQSRSEGYCTGPNADYDCTVFPDSEYIARKLYCSCTDGQCVGGTYYMNGTAYGQNCSYSLRQTTCS